MTTRSDAGVSPKPTPASQCRRFLTGAPLDLTDDEALFEPLDATGSHGR